MEEGYSDEQISDVCVDLTKVGFAQLMTKAVEHFTNEDFDRINALPEEQQEEEIKKLYKERTGQDTQEVMDTFISTFSETFLAEYKKKNPPKAV